MSLGTHHELGFAACVECSTGDEWMTTEDWQADGWVSGREGTAGMRFARSGMARTWAETLTENDHYCSTSDWGITSRMKHTVWTVNRKTFPWALFYLSQVRIECQLSNDLWRSTMYPDKWTHKRFHNQRFAVVVILCWVVCGDIPYHKWNGQT